MKKRSTLNTIRALTLATGAALLTANSAIAQVDPVREYELRRNGVVHFDETITGAACITTTFVSGNSNVTSASAGSLPSNIPQPLNTIFSEAAAAHNASATMIAVIYATENALYQSDAHLGSDWLIDRVHANDWRTSGGGARGPFQFLDGTWSSYSQEGPFIREGGQWTTVRGDGDGVNVNHIDDAAYGAAEFLASIGGVSSAPLGSIDQDFSRGNPNANTIASALKSYNAGPGTWREDGVWYRNVGGTPTPWGEAKQSEINGYIRNGLEMFSELGGANLTTGSASGFGCNAAAVGDADIINLANLADEWPEFADRPVMSNPSAIALHWTAGNPNTSGEDFIGTIAGREGACCSVQFYVNASGEIYQLTDPITEITSHIGEWNDNAIGIEIAAGSDGTVATAQREILSQQAQQDAVVQLVLFLMSTYNIPAQANFPTSCGTVNDFPPTGLIGHLDNPCSTKVDPSREYLELIRARVSR